MGRRGATTAGRILEPPPVWSSAFTRLDDRRSKGRLKAELQTDRVHSLGGGIKMRPPGNGTVCGWQGRHATAYPSASTSGRKSIHQRLSLFIAPPKPGRSSQRDDPTTRIRTVPLPGAQGGLCLRMLSNVSALAYLKQAEEIFAKGNIATEGLSHPEAFIRARALALWQEQRNEAATQISEMIEGAPALDELDVIVQSRLTFATRRLLEHLLRPKWFQTPAVLGHAKLFFADFQPASADDLRLGNVLKFSDAKLREYLCYVLLD